MEICCLLLLMSVYILSICLRNLYIAPSKQTFVGANWFRCCYDCALEMDTWWHIPLRSRTNVSFLTATRATVTSGLSGATSKITTSSIWIALRQRRPARPPCCPVDFLVTLERVYFSLTHPSWHIFLEEWSLALAVAAVCWTHLSSLAQRTLHKREPGLLDTILSSELRCLSLHVLVCQ